jgi:hypothetical protein
MQGYSSCFSQEGRQLWHIAVTWSGFKFDARGATKIYAQPPQRLTPLTFKLFFKSQPGLVHDLYDLRQLSEPWILLQNSDTS